MITIEKVRIFSRWDGDEDMFGRAGKEREKNIIGDEDFYLIDRMLEDHIVIKRSLGSEERVAKAKKRFEELCEGREVIDEIGKLAEKSMRRQKFRAIIRAFL